MQLLCLPLFVSLFATHSHAYPNAPEAECSAKIAEAVDKVVERLQDDDRDVRQAAFDTIPRLLVVGLSVGSTFMCTSNTFQGECRTKIVGTVQTIVGLFTSDRWVTRQIALKVIGMLAAVRECLRYPFTHVYLMLLKRSVMLKLERLRNRWWGSSRTATTMYAKPRWLQSLSLH